ncbi:MAG: hypothetical protein U0520_02795 [Candidatus Saccharimonadales bacterium]
MGEYRFFHAGHENYWELQAFSSMQRHECNSIARIVDWNKPRKQGNLLSKIGRAQRRRLFGNCN